jgi:uncharacterized membrane protein
MSKETKESPQVYHILAFQFEGRDRAAQVVDLLRKGGRSQKYKVPAWAVVEVDDKGKSHVQQSGKGGVGAAAGAGVGVLLGLIGGPAGLLAWTLGSALVGGIAGKRLGQPLDSDQLKALAVDMAPNTSGILVVIEDKLAQDAAAAMGEYGAKVVTLTLGDQLSGEVATFEAVDLGDTADVDVEEAADADAPEKTDQPAA